jgi:hypothetical protein
VRYDEIPQQAYSSGSASGPAPEDLVIKEWIEEYAGMTHKRPYGTY